MLFDLRLPLGLLFLAIGVLVAGYGLLGHVALSAGINIDLIWGAAMAAFGVLMLILTALPKRPAPVASAPPPEA